MIRKGVAGEVILAAFDHAADMVLCTGQDGRIVYANGLACLLLGYSADELFGLRYQDIAPEETDFRRKDGAMLPVEVSRGEAGGVSCFVARAGSAHREAAVELEELGRLARHDLREPLRAITTFSELLREDLGTALPAPARRDLDFIVDAAGRTERLLNAMTSLLRAGRAEMKPKPVELNACADDAIAALGAAVLESRADIRLAALPRVTGDAGLLKQLFQNLISNALKFSGSKRPEVRILAELREGGLTVCVADSGIGIPPERRERVFEPFQRPASEGVGLAICRKIVHRHGGRIWIESESGRGCTVCFTLGGWPGEPV